MSTIATLFVLISAALIGAASQTPLGEVTASLALATLIGMLVYEHHRHA